MDTSATQGRIKCDLHRCMTDRNPPCIQHWSHVCLHLLRRHLVGLEILHMKLPIMCSMGAAVSAVSCMLQWGWLSISMEL